MSVLGNLRDPVVPPDSTGAYVFGYSSSIWFFKAIQNGQSFENDQQKCHYQEKIQSTELPPSRKKSISCVYYLVLSCL
jgi:hypothetical protein